MTEDEIKKALKSDEAKAAIAAAIEDATKGLKDKNAELLASLKKEKDEKSDVLKRLDAIEADKTKAETEAAEKSGDIAKLREQMESQHKKEIEAKDEQIGKLNGQLNSHVIGEGLTQALVKAKVPPHFLDGAKALIQAQYKGEVGEIDGKPFAKFDGKAVEEFVTGWSQSDAGKHFVSADGNSGGGSNGADGSGKAGNGANVKQMARSEFEQLSPSEKVKVSGEGVKLVDDAA